MNDDGEESRVDNIMARFEYSTSHNTFKRGGGSCLSNRAKAGYRLSNYESFSFLLSHFSLSTFLNEECKVS
jgi:hypothetical protein